MRAMKESGDAFRVREEITFPSGSKGVYYHGPYATVGTAKAQRSRILRNRHGVRTITVEKTSTNWEEVPE